MAVLKTSTIQQVFLAFCILNTFSVFLVEAGLGQCALNWAAKGDRADCTNFGGAKYDCPVSSCTINGHPGTSSKGRIRLHRCEIHDRSWNHKLAGDVQIDAESFAAQYNVGTDPHGLGFPWLEGTTGYAPGYSGPQNFLCLLTYNQGNFPLCDFSRCKYLGK